MIDSLMRKSLSVDWGMKKMNLFSHISFSSKEGAPLYFFCLLLCCHHELYYYWGYLLFCISILQFIWLGPLFLPISPSLLVTYFLAPVLDILCTHLPFSFFLILCSFYLFQVIKQAFKSRQFSSSPKRCFFYLCPYIFSAIRLFPSAYVSAALLFLPGCHQFMWASEFEH